MKKNHWMLRLIGLMLASYSLLIVTMAASGGAGSQSDPLVTLSYLNETFLPQLLGRVDEKLAARDRELSDKLDAQMKQELQAFSTNDSSANTGSNGADKGISFSVVTLSNGKTLYGEIGCEVMLRVGTASCVSPSEPGLIDETDGTTLGSGKALVKNHLYMMTIDGRGVRASADTVKLLVRGAYTVK